MDFPCKASYRIKKLPAVIKADSFFWRRQTQNSFKQFKHHAPVGEAYLFVY